MKVKAEDDIDPDEFQDGGWGPTEDEEEVMREIEEGMMKDHAREEEKKDSWLPPGIEPVLEEQPKWMLLAGVLEEIEEDLYWNNVDPREFFPAFSLVRR